MDFEKNIQLLSYTDQKQDFEAAFAEKSRKQIKAKNEQTFGNDTSHERLNDLLSNCSISLAFVILVSVLKSRTRNNFLDS